MYNESLIRVFVKHNGILRYILHDYGLKTFQHTLSVLYSCSFSILYIHGPDLNSLYKLYTNICM